MKLEKILNDIDAYISLNLNEDSFKKFARLLNIDNLELYQKTINYLVDGRITIDDLDKIEVMTDFYLEEFLLDYDYRNSDKHFEALNNSEVVKDIENNLEFKEWLKTIIPTIKETTNIRLYPHQIEFGQIRGSIYATSSSFEIAYHENVDRMFNVLKYRITNKANFNFDLINDQIIKDAFINLYDIYISDVVNNINNTYFLVDSPYMLSYVSTHSSIINELLNYNGYNKETTSTIHQLIHDIPNGTPSNLVSKCLTNSKWSLSHKLQYVSFLNKLMIKDDGIDEVIRLIGLEIYKVQNAINELDGIITNSIQTIGRY